MYKNIIVVLFRYGTHFSAEVSHMMIMYFTLIITMDHGPFIIHGETFGNQWTPSWYNNYCLGLRIDEQQK